MIDMRYKPQHLPQVSAPYDIVLSELNTMGVDYKLNKQYPDKLSPSQGFSFCDDFEHNDNPIWVAGKTDDENVIIDGHHRWVNCLSKNEPIKTIKIMLNPRDACRQLNKVQDIYEYKEKIKLEELVGVGNTINYENEKDNFESDWLASVENPENIVISEEDDQKNNTKKIIGYRNKPIVEKSLVGNYFSLIPVDGWERYEIEFDNLLDTEDLGLTYYSGQNPVDILVKIWYPNIDFEKLSEKHNTTPDNIKSRSIVERAKKLGFDGIKYGNILIQGIN